MLAVFGANGMTGRAVVREAKLRGVPVRAIARNDHDTRHLEDLVDVNEIAFADANQPASIPAVLTGITAVVSCLDARTAGWGSPIYEPHAAANVVHAAHDAGITKILHVSIMGAYRWSSNPLNRQSFHLDRWVKRSGVPWTMLRVSCYHDELIDSHIRPPDGGRPHPIHRSARYSPVSRRDVARVIHNILPDLIPSRTWLVGGPLVYHGDELKAAVAPYITGQGKRTERGPLPRGDMSVPPETTQIMVGWVPQESLLWALDPENNPFGSEQEAPFWTRERPSAHPLDMSKDASIFQYMNPALRYAIHALCAQDIKRLGLDQNKVKGLSFVDATARKTKNKGLPHKAPMSEIDNVQIIGQDDAVLHDGSITFIYDDLADEFLVWWEEDTNSQIPADIWEQLDMGVRRRLAKHPTWKHDTQVRAFAAKSHEKTASR
ncbi:MAG: SDR family oxidoreductase [Myxococcota bacterium]